MSSHESEAIRCGSMSELLKNDADRQRDTGRSGRLLLSVRVACDRPDAGDCRGRGVSRAARACSTPDTSRSTGAKAEQKMVAAFDQDGDGKLTKEDLGAAKNRILPILTKGLPGTGGFMAGFVIALKVLLSHVALCFVLSLPIDRSVDRESLLCHRARRRRMTNS
jgi:hypothetical protein